MNDEIFNKIIKDIQEYKRRRGIPDIKNPYMAFPKVKKQKKQGRKERSLE
jgi:hypothetical protein